MFAMWSTWVLLLLHVFDASSFVLDGSPTSYARFPKWYHAFANRLGFEFRTKQTEALLLYTDDGGAKNFFELRLVRGHMQLQFRLGKKTIPGVAGTGTADSIHRLTADTTQLADDQWHRVQLGQQWETVTLEVDAQASHLKLEQQDFSFGLHESNSDIFVGGIPVNIAANQLSYPLAKQMQHLQGSVRNLVYHVFEGVAGVTAPHILDSQGIRDSTDDYCGNVICQHEGYCYNSDSGPVCQCLSGYHGSSCQIENKTHEATFLGREFLAYDLRSHAAAFTSKEEMLTLFFKTTQMSAILFYSGDQKDFLHVALVEGQVVATSNVGGGRIEVSANNYHSSTDVEKFTRGIRFNDNRWHRLILHRRLSQLSISVDGVYTDIGHSATWYRLLTSTFAYVAALPAGEQLPLGLESRSFIGCMSKIRYQSEGRHLDFLQSVHSADGLVTATANLSTHCTDLSKAQPITFLTSDSFLTLPAYAVGRQGTVEFSIRTNELYGLIWYSGDSPGLEAGFLGFELVAGFLYIGVNFGSGPLHLKVSNFKLSDSQWHSVKAVKRDRTIEILIDSRLESQFDVPSPSGDLKLGSQVFIGGLEWSNPSIYESVSSALWTNSLRLGFIGCLKDVAFDGKPIRIAEYLHQQSSSQLLSGCHDSLPLCPSAPCLHSGSCTEGWLRYVCDCPEGIWGGRSCEQQPTVVHFDKGQSVQLGFPYAVLSEADDISFKFQTTTADSYLLGAAATSSSDRIDLMLIGGALLVAFNFGDGLQNLKFGQQLHDHRWHAARVRRRNKYMQLHLDGKEIGHKHQQLPNTTRSVLRYDVIWAGVPLAALPGQQLGGFRGQMAWLVWNQQDIFELAVRASKVDPPMANVSVTATVGHVNRAVRHPVMFKARNGYLALPPHLLPSAAFVLGLQFRTLDANALLLYSSGASTQDFLSIELWQGHLRYSFNLGDGPEVVVAKQKPLLNDYRWHSVLLQKPHTAEHLLTVDGNSFRHKSRVGVNRHMNLHGPLFVGGLEYQNYSALPKQLHARHGFRGCLGDLHVNGVAIHLINHAQSYSEVQEGCEELRYPCTDNSCANGGACLQNWSDYICDCSMTSFSGPKCNEIGITFYWKQGGKGAVQLQFEHPQRTSTTSDRLAVGVLTNQSHSLLLFVESATATDFLRLQTIDGYVYAIYNLGDNDYRVGELRHPVSDGAFHVIRFERHGKNATLQLDTHPANHHVDTGKGLEVFNFQSNVWVGGVAADSESSPPAKSKDFTDAHFEGAMTGLVYNSMRILELAAEGSPLVTVHGSVEEFSAGTSGGLEMPLPAWTLPQLNPDDFRDRMMKSAVPSDISEQGGDDLFISGSGCGPSRPESQLEECIPLPASSSDLITPYLPHAPTPPTTTSTTPTSTSSSTPTPTSSTTASTTALHTTTSAVDDSWLPEPPPEQPSPTGEAKSSTSRSWPSPDEAVSSSSTTPLPPGSAGGSRHSTKTAVVAGVAVALIVAVILAVVLVCKCRRKSSPQSSMLLDEHKFDADAAASTAHNQLLPAALAHSLSHQHLNGGLANGFAKPKVPLVATLAAPGRRKKDAKEWFV